MKQHPTNRHKREQKAILFMALKNYREFPSGAATVKFHQMSEKVWKRQFH